MEHMRKTVLLAAPLAAALLATGGTGVALAAAPALGGRVPAFSVRNCRGAPVEPGDWVVYGGGPAPPGAGVPVPGAGGRYGAWQTPVRAGARYAEPVIADGCLYVATEGDSLYAFDALSGAFRWHDRLGTPVPARELPCGDVAPAGITGTPVVDVRKGLVWVTAFVEGRHGPEHELFGLGMANGHVVREARVDPAGLAPSVEQQRGALALGDGNVYIPFGGLYGDCGSYRGALVSVPEAAGHQPGYWRVPTAKGGGLWAPAGPDVLANGDLLFATGNGAGGPGQGWDGSNGIFELSPAFVRRGSFAPRDWAALNQSDSDLGSTEPALLPGGLALQVGKDGVGYLVAIAHLGGVGGQLAESTVCPSGGAFGNDAVAGTTAYVPCQAGLTAVEASRHSLRVLWRSSSASPGSPVIAGGKIWDVTSTGLLEGILPGTGRVVQTFQLASPVTHFPWLVPAGETMYAPDGNRVMDLTGL